MVLLVRGRAQRVLLLILGARYISLPTLIREDWYGDEEGGVDIVGGDGWIVH